MLKFYKLLIFSACLVCGLFVLGNISCVQADTAKESFNKSLLETAQGTGHSTVQSGSLLPETVGKIVKIFLSFIGVIFLILMIYGGYVWMMARGNEQEVNKAQKIIQMAVIGMIIVLSAYTATILIGKIIK